MRSCSLRFEGRTHQVHVGRRLQKAIAAHVARLNQGGQVALVTDAKVARLHGGALERALRARGLRVQRVLLPQKEKGKALQQVARSARALLQNGFERSDTVVALGGGAVCDSAGFLSSVILRGVGLVLAPTTLLAMVDAGIGAKTAVNLPEGKNLLGAFHAPTAVFSDLDMLETLSKAEMKNGFAEMVKTGAVCDASLFTHMEGSSTALLKQEPRALERAVFACAQAKARIVESDPRESGRRAILNFGHTAGHALEHASRHTIPHGLAIAAGMHVELAVAQKQGRVNAQTVQRVENLLAELKMPRAKQISLKRTLTALEQDKKKRKGVLRVCVPVAIGKCANPPVFTATPREISRALKQQGVVA